jgi:hypothetical protein
MEKWLLKFGFGFTMIGLVCVFLMRAFIIVDASIEEWFNNLPNLLWGKVWPWTL